MHIAQEQSHKDCHPEFISGSNLVWHLPAKILKKFTMT